jgi:hypothetical protein
MFVIVLRQMGVAPRTVAARLSGVAAASLVMAAVCLLGRQALEAIGVEMAGRAALTIGFGLAVYGGALWWLAPQISRRVVAIGRSRLRNVINARRRPVFES